MFEHRGASLIERYGFMFCDGTQTVEHWQQLEFASHEGNLEGFSRSGGVDAGAYTHHVNLVQFSRF